jgi:hypothetical protein
VVLLSVGSLLLFICRVASGKRCSKCNLFNSNVFFAAIGAWLFSLPKLLGLPALADAAH